MNVTFCVWNARHKKAVLPMWAVWAKPLSHPKHAIAVLAVNVADSAQSMSVTLEELLRANAGAGAGAARATYTTDMDMVKNTVFEATDVWSGKVTARVRKDAPWYVRDLEPHDSRFVVFAPVAPSIYQNP
jgi:hypothetical protein